MAAKKTASKRGPAPGRRRPPAGRDHEDVEDVGPVALARFGDRAAVVPRSMLRASDDQVDAVHELMSITDDLRRLERIQAEAVQDARSAGISWEVIGWASGITGRGASMRWGA